MWDRIKLFLLGDPIEMQLPERVRRAIEEQQMAGERLICWTQLLVAACFGTLYAVSPKTFMAGDIEPVPVFLGLYAGFTAIRLLLAHRRTLPAWLIALSVVVDMVLLLALIWSFHIQYDQPASFSLRAPTMLYIFILIVMRALAFEPRYVLLAGSAAIVGWLGILADAVLFSPNGVAITKDFTRYLYSADVLLGAEIDKMLAIGMVTLVLAIALVRARRLMVRAIAEGAMARDLSRFFSPEIAEKIVRSDRQIEAGHGEQRRATVMFTDIEGFTTISERLSPAEVIQMLNEYFAVVTGPVVAHHGVINQFRGDAMLVTFNMPTDDPDHAANALRAALAIQAATHGRRFLGDITLNTRIGINTGDVVFGAVGAEGRLDFTIHGDIVNAAARLEQLNKNYGTYILTTADTVAEAGTGFKVREIGETTVRGKQESLRLFTLDDRPITGTEEAAVPLPPPENPDPAPPGHARPGALPPGSLPTG